MKKALITGITGQDGSYLAEFLLEKGYEVHGIIRRASVSTTARIDHIMDKLIIHEGDLSDSSSIIRIVLQVKPDEIYNLAAQSHVQVSFDAAEYTGDVDALGVLRILEAVHTAGLDKICRVYQASTSELYGKVEEVPQSETTPFHPYSPYAVAKQYGFWMIKEYREAYGIFACNGILFNHESERRGDNFVTRKITLAAGRIACGLQDHLELGNLDSLRDWGYAKDYVECMWLILQQNEPDDYVIATGVQHTVREFTTLAFANDGIELEWRGEGILVKTYSELVEENRVSYPLVLAGRKGWKMDNLLSGISNIAKEKILFTGFIDDEDLPAVYANANLFVFPSRYEGFGMPPLEAIACGTRVLSSDASSLPEVLGDTANYFENQNKDDFKEKILLCINESNVNEMKHKSDYVNQVKMFDWKVEAVKLLEKIEEVVN